MTTRADGHQQHEHQRGRRAGRAQHLGHSMFPVFAATIVGCTVRSLRRRTSPRTWPACGRRVPRGGVIFPDGCVDLVWRGDGLVVAGPATGPMTPAVAVGRAGLRRALPARRGRRGARAARPASSRRDRAGRRRVGPGRRRARGGRRAARAAGRSCASACAARVDPLARAAALAMARPGRARGRARRGAGRERAPAAPPLRRRRRLRAEDARARAALPALPALGGDGGELARAGACERGLRRPGAPHARDAGGWPAARPLELCSRRRRASAGGRALVRFVQAARSRSAAVPCRRDDR